ncbi:Bug family tripartite tricarboxylate transporter substrate binding protein [Spiribacter halobius]|uniref:C4-dicarboxylate ABC transporter substrate-binding protein n=1 Tax=Sediminicurvatus halobius TaxID=2182432 RepID=A0A2U2N1Q3_9GAMM|nr:tripartite tricarboxylate transporter substrate-binding protein [Spiribacter halobius]PWG63155.1 C4-dicarboxylate ABC transporter substrate-binding protein [Spiribacter halobius]UEX77603.1 tripartite tricarboxylate transporter substrate binding protein [Spiribacter halobius]
MSRLWSAATFAAVSLIAMLPGGAAAQDFTASGVECIAPADPGGGWDFTCRSVGRILDELDLVEGSVNVTNMAGAGGGVAYSNVVSKRADDDNLIVAASTATTTRLAQNQYAGLSADQVRWIATLGADFGVIAVSPDSEHEDLNDLMEAIAENPRDVSFGGGSAVGGWDHLKVLLAARAAGVEDVRAIKYVSFNNGGTAITQMRGGHIDAFTGDLSEATGQIEAGAIRVLAVLADERLPDKFSDLPTAAEQGVDVVGANWRGFYAGGEMSDAAYDYWVNAMEEVYNSTEWQEAMTRNGLVPFWRAGEEMDDFVNEQVAELTELSREIGILQE